MDFYWNPLVVCIWWNSPCLHITSVLMPGELLSTTIVINASTDFRQLLSIDLLWFNWSKMSEHFPVRLAKQLCVLFPTWFTAHLCPVRMNINETAAATTSSSTTVSRNNSDLRDILREVVSSCQYAVPLSATLSKTKVRKTCIVQGTTNCYWPFTHNCYNFHWVY